MSKLSVALQDRLAAMGAMLRAEEAEVRARNERQYEHKTDRQLEHDGLLLRAARVEEEGRALFGRARLVLGDDTSRRGHVDRFGARPGTVVWLRDKDERGQVTLGAQGIVTLRRPSQLVVLFDDAASVSELTTIDLLRGEDEVSLRRMEGGLERVRRLEGANLRLLETLLAERCPKPPRVGTWQALDTALNDDQRRAVEIALFSEELALVHGPPGTGKTRVLVEVVRQCLARGERVLCLAASNAAVDNLAIALLDADGDLPLARAGHPARVHPQLEEHTLAGLTAAHDLRVLARKLLDDAHGLLRGARRRSDRGREAWHREREARVEAGRLFADARRLERQAVDDVLRRTRVLCGTLTGYETELPEDARFDVLVVDEASQVLSPALLLGVPRAGRVVLAGDHRQLPPTVISLEATRLGLGSTSFDALMSSEDSRANAHMLTVQHRMHHAIMAFPAAQFYDDRLVAHPKVEGHTLSELGLEDTALMLPERALDVIDTAGAGHEERQSEQSESRDNPGEAALVVRIVRALLAGGISLQDIGVITPYAAQVALLATELSTEVQGGLEIDSVDGFQGREKEAIVFSCVRSNSLGQVGFVADARRVNVALTRARRKLVVIGDSATLSSDGLWGAFFTH
ncbi:MAG: AAA domain-containing protein, partial [Myxococcota bacterium]